MKMLSFFAPALCAVTLCAADVTDDFSSGIWSHWNISEAKVAFSHGNGTAEISMKEGNPAGKGGYFLKNFPAAPGKTYSVSVMVSGKDAAAELSVQAFKDGKFMSVISASSRKVSSEAAPISFSFETPAGTTEVRALLGAGGPAGASAAFDNFKLAETDPSKGVKDSFDSAVWGFWKADGAKLAPEFAPETGHSVKGSASIKVLPGNPESKTGCFTNHVPVKPGKEYTFLVWVKGSGFESGANFSLGIQGQNAKRGFLGTGVQSASANSAACKDWKRIVLTFKVPETGAWKNCAFVLVTLGVKSASPGTVYFDDFEFFPEEP